MDSCTSSKTQANKQNVPVLDPSSSSSSSSSSSFFLLLPPPPPPPPLLLSSFFFFKRENVIARPIECYHAPLAGNS
ncbi:hypothetical protein SprV_0401686100 [Sparganum proliferum]